MENFTAAIIQTRPIVQSLKLFINNLYFSQGGIMCTIVDFFSEKDLNNLIFNRLRTRGISESHLESQLRVLIPIIKSASPRTIICISSSCRLPMKTVELYLEDLEARKIVASSFHKNFKRKNNRGSKKYFCLSEDFQNEIKETINALRKLTN